MTPCDSSGLPDFDALVATAERLVETGMRGVVYCGSMGDWPLLTDEQRQEGVSRLAKAGIPVVVGTGAHWTQPGSRQVWPANNTSTSLFSQRAV